MSIRRPCIKAELIAHTILRASRLEHAQPYLLQAGADGADICRSVCATEPCAALIANGHSRMTCSEEQQTRGPPATEPPECRNGAR